MSTVPGVFISYSHQDRFIATTLADRLREIGYHPWIDIEGISGGDDWRQGIDRALIESRACVVILTPDALESRWVRYEYARARDLHRLIIPLLFRDCRVPDDLQALHYLDFRQDSDGAFRDLQRALVRAVLAPDAPGLAATPLPRPISRPFTRPETKPVQPPLTLATANDSDIQALTRQTFKRGEPITRHILTALNRDAVITSATAYLKLVGFKQTQASQGSILFARRVSLRHVITYSPRAAKTQVRLTFGDAPRDDLLRVTVVYHLYFMRGWWVTRWEPETWVTEVLELEDAITNGIADHARSTHFEELAARNSCLVSVGLVLVLGVLVFGALVLFLV